MDFIDKLVNGVGIMREVLADILAETFLFSDKGKYYIRFSDGVNTIDKEISEDSYKYLKKIKGKKK